MKKFLHIAKYTVLYIVQLLVIVLVVGRIYEVMAEARDQKRLPPPGQLFEVDGHMMHIHCQGQGTPTIIVEQGNDALALSWSDVNESMSRLTRTCTYDRAGTGYSEPADGPVSTAIIAQKLNRLLQAADVTDDLILVGWAAGGIYQREFYRQFPERVKGMVLVDSAHEQQTGRLPPEATPQTFDTSRLYHLLAPFGALRLSGRVEREFANSTFSAPIRDRLVVVNLKSYSYGVLRAERAAFEAELALQRDPPPLDDLPLIVITQGKPTDVYMQENLELWNELQEELKNLSSNSKRVIAANSPHAIHRYEPGLIVEAAREVLDAARSGGRIR